MTDLAALRRGALDWITANETRMSAFNERIWHFAEPAWREYRSARAYVDFLRAEGFEVEEGSGGMPTAFVAAATTSPSPRSGSFFAAFPNSGGSCRLPLRDSREAHVAHADTSRSLRQAGFPALMCHDLQSRIDSEMPDGSLTVPAWSFI